MGVFHIGDHPVGPTEPTLVIAEAGSNHNGDLETAKNSSTSPWKPERTP